MVQAGTEVVGLADVLVERREREAHGDTQLAHSASRQVGAHGNTDNVFTRAHLKHGIEEASVPQVGEALQ